MTLGNRIKAQRNKLGLSQEKIAEMVGTSRQAVTKWESDKSVPCMENLITLADIFGISLGELSGGKSNDEPAVIADKEAELIQHRKKPFLMDAVFILVTIFAVWSILQIPTFIGMTMVGFLFIVAQAAAVLFVPLYLLLIRPRKMKHVNTEITMRGRGSIKERLFWALGAVVALVAGYVLCGHVFLFLHGMGQWPIILFVFGLAVIGIAAISNRQKVMICVVAGYVVGFVLGMLLNSDTYHPYRGPGVYSNNNWVIWTATYLIFIIAGITWEIVSRIKNR